MCINKEINLQIFYTTRKKNHKNLISLYFISKFKSRVLFMIYFVKLMKIKKTEISDRIKIDA